MYKIISNDKVLDVVQYPKFLRFLPTGHIAFTDKASAQGILGSDETTIYSFEPVANKNYLIVTISKITSEKDFKRLQSLLKSNQVVSADESKLAKAKQAKIDSLSSQCNSIITAGFAIVLSDGISYKFKLTAEDQLNLMLIENRLMVGDSAFVYHATNQPCQIFSGEDMRKVIAAFRRHILYHTTYFNAAKQYIKALSNTEKVNLFTYGIDVSDAVEDPMIRQILKNGGVK